MIDYEAWARPRFEELQNGYVGSTRSRGDMAALRASLRKPCGTDVRAAAWSIDGLESDSLAHSPMEEASWYAFALYAIHQQGLHQAGMYEPGRRFNWALRQIRDREPEVPKLVRRLTSARSLQDAVVVCKRLILLLRAHGEPCDHVLLALDLRDFQCRGRSDRVKYSWSRGLCE